MHFLESQLKNKMRNIKETRLHKSFPEDKYTIEWQCTIVGGQDEWLKR